MKRRRLSPLVNNVSQRCLDSKLKETIVVIGKKRLGRCNQSFPLDPACFAHNAVLLLELWRLVL
jgi:hypothetical protein